MNKKLIVNEWFKTYSLINVSVECFKNSPEKEILGTATAFKIHNLENLNFRIAELKRLNFSEDKK